MAKKLELIGYFQEIGEPKIQGAKGTKVQEIIFMLFGYQNLAQGIEEPDEPWYMKAIGKKVDELNLNPHMAHQLAKVTVYIEGKAVPGTETRKAFFTYECNIVGVEIINPNERRK